MFCQKCGKQLIGNEKFCVECGQPIQNNKLHDGKGPPRKELKPFYLALAIVAGIVVTLLMGYYALCTYFLSANQYNLCDHINSTYVAKYGQINSLIWPKDLSDIEVEIKGDEAIITGKYSKPSGDGGFIAYYDDIFRYFPDLTGLWPDKVTLSDSVSGD